MSPTLRVALFAPLAFAVAGVAHAADPASAPDTARTPDESVKARLEARGLKYEIDADGDFKLVYSFEEDKRSQIVFISGAAESVGDYKVREVFAPAARVKRDRIDGDVALELLAKSRNNKIGAWEIGGDLLYYVVKLPDSIDAAQLESVLQSVAGLADDEEAKRSGDLDEL